MSFNHSVNKWFENTFMDSPIIVLTDGYLGNSTIASELATITKRNKLVAIDYEDLTQTQEVVSGLDGYVICLSGPGAFPMSVHSYSVTLPRTRMSLTPSPYCLRKMQGGKMVLDICRCHCRPSASMGAMSVV